MNTPKPPDSPDKPLRPFKSRIHLAKKQKVVLPKKITLDWKAYFLEFCGVHGEPIEYNNVLLFPDGWRYALDYQGPEYPPPAEHKELDLLVTKYWMSKWRQVNRMLTLALGEKDRLTNLMANHSLELQQTVFLQSGDKTQKGAAPLDLRPLDERIRWLREDVNDCEKMLREVEEFHQEKSHVNA